MLTEITGQMLSLDTHGVCTPLQAVSSLAASRYLTPGAGDGGSCPGGSEGKASACNAGDLDSIPGSGRSPEKEPTPVFLPGESHGRRSLVGYSLRGRKELDRTE